MLFCSKNFAMTRGISELLSEEEVHVLLNRHFNGDYGNVCDDDKKLNVDAVKNGGMILSSYTVRENEVWVITESDRSVTTVLLPGEY